MKSNSALALGDVLATAEDRDLIFTALVSLSGVSLTFIQFRNSAWEVGKKPSKRFIKLAASKLPDVAKKDIPVLEKITQPFDELYFMYVQDGANHKGFTKAEVDAINDHTGEQMIFYKPRKKDHDAADVVVESGCHFVLVMKDKENKKKVVVDYVFARPKSEEKVASPALALRNHVLVEREYGVDVIVTRERLFQVGALQQNLAEDEMAMLLDDSQRTKGDGSTSKAALKKTMGPLSISNIGLRFKENKLSVCMDASVVLGPTTLDLLGFSIDLDLSQAKFQGKFDANMIGVSLQGLAVALEKPPLTVAGGLFHEGKYWAGGVDIAWAPWNFMAGGGYGSVPGPNGEFKSAFVLAALDGPLLTLQYATISGVTGGFGYNTAITLPRVEEVPTFPFIQMPKKKELLASGKSGVIEMMESLVESKWFKPQVDEFWVAAGLTVTAFQMLQVKAAVVVNWGKEVRLGIFAVAVADVPSTASPFKIAHVEMGILATINFDKGVAKIEAQLAPSSFILDPSCHLTGGMALYYWFKDGPEQIKGDTVLTVLTLGGYHPAYKPPTQYPNPPRLGIAWSLGPLSITGSAYFAITPKVAMAGVQLHASLTIGVLHAFLDAWADFLINYRPFMFTATAGVAVGVRFTLDKWFVTIHINVQIGARLFLQGPPFKGICHVDFWLFGFDIAFGSQGIVEGPDAISLLEFYCLALQKGSPSSGTTSPVPHLYTCMGGLIPAASSAPVSSALTTNSPPRSLKEGPGSSKDEPAAKEPWRVAAGTFAFAISSVFALSAVSIRYSTDQVGKISKCVPRPQNETSPVFARPMHLQHESLESTLRITITLPPAPKSPQPSKTTDKDGRPNWGISVITDSVPRALWDKYDPSSDPSGGSRALLDSSNPNVTLMTGIKLTSPDPDFSDDKIAPFDTVASQISDVVLKPVALPDAKATPDKSWAPVEPVEPLPENPAKAWKDVQDLWDTPKRGKGAGVKAVEAWASVMEWKCGKGDVFRLPKGMLVFVAGRWILHVDQNIELLFALHYTGG
ncbi:hypothetical protein AK830_g5109 [Neonectria ditissima]|uniref:DUF6603 domain-containing protein n=1 Tax=Neonectria ditissima TaxID=78410 RepID=A0A0P7B521_9HYPO|nr:hypothetical protein AK830_g5109 [Neonectria ditissima]